MSYISRLDGRQARTSPWLGSYGTMLTEHALGRGEQQDGSSVQVDTLGPWDYPQKYQVADRFLVHCWYPPVGSATPSSQSFLVQGVDVTTALAWAEQETRSQTFELFVDHLGDWILLHQNIPHSISNPMQDTDVCTWGHSL